MCRVRVTGGPECLCEKREHAKRVIDLTNSSDELLSVFDSFHYIPHNHPSHNLGFHSNRNISAADLSHHTKTTTCAIAILEAIVNSFSLSGILLETKITYPDHYSSTIKHIYTFQSHGTTARHSRHQESFEPKGRLDHKDGVHCWPVTVPFPLF